MNVLRASLPRVVECWFDEPLPAGADVVILRQYTLVPLPVETTTKKTLVLDLARDQEDLFKGLGSETRRLIRRAQGDADILMEHTSAPDADWIDAFVGFYKGFAAEKGLAPVTRESITSRAASGMLHLSRASRGGEPLVWHSYICANGRARLLHSASQFRESDKEFRDLVSRTNRALHWQDILTLHGLGMHTYDFGGWYGGTEDKARLAINRFKESFGGTLVEENEATVGLTWLGRLYLRLRRRLRPGA